MCNIGGKLADNINIRNSNNIYNFPSKLVNNNTFFFYPTNKMEIINIVENSKNKKSNNLFQINMDISKKTIYVIPVNNNIQIYSYYEHTNMNIL